MVARGLFRVETVFGPTFSIQVWSTIWAAIVWPKIRFSLGIIRWTTAGKKPSMFEKW